MTTNEEKIAAIVSQIIHVPVEQLDVDTDLRIAHNIDSLAALQIIAAVETQFGIEIPENRLTDYATIRDMAELATAFDKKSPGDGA